MQEKGNRSGELLIGLGGLAVVLLGISSALTQYIAQQLAYHPLLGSPWSGKFYAPWAWLYWQAIYYKSAPNLFNIAYICFLSAIGGAFLIHVLVFGFITRKSKQHKGVHGTAHWAKEHEVRQSGLLPRSGESSAGVYVGGWQDPSGRLRYLRHNGPEHIAGIAPTRSGKGVGLVVPSLLSWPHSVVINDMKGELWALTAGWRKQEAGNMVLKFDPASEKGSCAFNPLEEVRLKSIHEVGDVQNLVTIIVDPDGRGLADHWAKTAHAFLTGLILHLLYNTWDKAQVAGLYDVALSLSDPQHPIDELYQAMLENKHDKGEAHPTIAAAARDMLNRPENERGSVLSSAMSYLSLYRDPLVAKNTARSDFRIADLMDYHGPVSLYLVVRPADKDRLKPLMRLLLNQIVRVLTRDEMKFKNGHPLPAHKHRLLLMLDEFPSFGRLEVFQEALAFIAGYGIKAYLIMQDISQLFSAYGPDESILSNCHVRVAYAPNKIETAEWLSKMTGQTTLVLEDVSMSGQRFGAILQNVNRTYHTVSRPLFTPDECMRLKGPVKDKEGRILEPGDVLIFTAGNAPIYGKQILYFIDPIFAERSKILAPDTDQLHRKKEVFAV
jgi:type IV secretion system protein VirD4